MNKVLLLDVLNYIVLDVHGTSLFLKNGLQYFEFPVYSLFPFHSRYAASINFDNNFTSVTEYDGAVNVSLTNIGAGPGTVCK